MGTIKANRKGLPLAPKTVSGVRTAKMVRGVNGQEQPHLEVASSSIRFLLHTILTMNSTCRRQVKDNRTKTWGRRQFQRGV